MQRDVKIGIAIGVLLIALIGIFWWLKSKPKTEPVVDDIAVTDPAMPGPQTPVGPANGAAPAGAEVAAHGVTSTTLAGGAAAGPVNPTTTTPGAAVAGPTVPVQGAAPAPTPAPAAQTHTVASGDSLAKISKQYFGTEAKAKAIADANNIALNSTLKIGQKLTIPAATGTEAPAPIANTVSPAPTPTPEHAVTAGKTHTVAKGETLSSISRKYYGSDSHVKAIYEANKAKMSSPNDLKIGMVLAIP